MKVEKFYQILGWFTDQFSKRNEHLMRVCIPMDSDISNDGVIEAYYFKDDKPIATSNRAFPAKMLDVFVGWMNLFIAEDSDVNLDFHGNSTASGILRLPGQKVYFHCFNYIESDHRISEIVFSYLGRPSDLVKTRFEAMKVIKQAGITEALSDAALMQVAHALLKNSAREV